MTRALVAILVALAACGDDDGDRPARREGSEPSTESPPREPASAPRIPAAVLDPYEAIRAALAADRIAGVWEPAAQLERAAAAAADGAAEPQREHYRQLSTAAARLRESPREGEGAAEETRRAFGEVSRHLVALVRSDASLASGLSAFECPMALGYRKWVQRGGALSNPYMGTRMPSCGSASDWSP